MHLSFSSRLRESILSLHLSSPKLVALSALTTRDRIYSGKTLNALSSSKMKLGTLKVIMRNRDVVQVVAHCVARVNLWVHSPAPHNLSMVAHTIITALSGGGARRIRNSTLSTFTWRVRGQVGIHETSQRHDDEQQQHSCHQYQYHIHYRHLSYHHHQNCHHQSSSSPSSSSCPTTEQEKKLLST